MEDRDEIQPFEFAQIVAGHLDPDTDTPGGFADGPEVEQIEDDPVDETDTDTAAEVTEDAHGNLHGPDGKFVPKDSDDDEETTDEEVESEELEAEEGEVPEGIVLEVDDPAVQAYLDKYDGDPVKALRAATEAQSVIGRQGSELGELKQTIAELTQLVKNGALAPPTAPVNWSVEIESNPQYAAQLALHHGDADQLIAAVEAWKDGTEYFSADPFGAAAFWVGLQQEFLADMAAAEEPAAQQQVAPQTDPAVDAEVAKVVQRHPDLPKYLEAIGEVANERPYLKTALESGTAQSRAQALEDLYLLARGRDTDTLAQTAATTVKTRTKQEARQARSGARVVSGRQRGGSGASQPTGADAFKAAFRERMGLPPE